ncbi:unnamed protein product [Paramecium sonneborni]|uniref:Transmembrane protein n=1 Tax=Paramecium sonneborni TaxID=65129 RepID=A0A8S1RDR9_9CILI|nr:unnamed protein product [Paramecium sonneborni]CAD8126396.1 unnamed protein product [Paramecium sonneborni]
MSKSKNLIIVAIICQLILNASAQCEMNNGQCPEGCNLVSGNCIEDKCNNYIQKLGNSTSNPFSGQLEFVNGTIDLNVTIFYIDDDYSDQKKFGIVKGENKESCLEMQIWMYQNSQYKIKQEISYPIQYINDNKNKRAYSYIIPSKDFVNQLQISENENYYLFNGFYGIEFKIGEIIQSQIYYDFYVKISKSSTGSKETTFGSLNSYMNSSTIQIIPKSILEFCNDETCTQTMNSTSLYLNDQVWLKHSINTSGLEGYYLTNPVIYFIGDNIFKQGTIKDKKLNQKGFSLYLMTVEIAWSNIKISAAATMSINAGNRFLAEDKTKVDYNSIQTTSSIEIDCIRIKETNQCCFDNETCFSDRLSPKLILLMISISLLLLL